MRFGRKKPREESRLGGPVSGSGPSPNEIGTEPSWALPADDAVTAWQAAAEAAAVAPAMGAGAGAAGSTSAASSAAAGAATAALGGLGSGGSGESGSGGALVAILEHPTVKKHPELLVAGAFVGAFVVARILKRISE